MARSMYVLSLMHRRFPAEWDCLWWKMPLAAQPPEFGEQAGEVLAEFGFGISTAAK